MDISRLIRRLKRWKEVAGYRYQCSLCRYYVGTFKPSGIDTPVLTSKQVIGGGYREQARCFICGSLDRDRLIYMYLKNHTSFLTHASKILHFAPEVVLSRELKCIKSHQYVTADIAAERADMIIDMTDIPFPDNQFDLIIANHVLEHIPDDKKALSELGRILKKNSGRAILQVPISLNSATTFEDPSIDTDAGRLEAFGQEDHVRIYGQDYSTKLKEAGFEVEVFDWENSIKLNPKNINKFGFLDNEKIYIASIDAA